MITYDLYKAVKTALSSCTRAQTLTLAALGLERLWPMFCAWTETEGDPLLYQRPRAFRQPARELLDCFWELAEGGHAEARLGRRLHHFLDFVNAACDPNDAPDVDMGTGRPLLGLMFGGVDCFLSEQDAESGAGACITEYAAYLGDRLYDQLYDQCRASIPLLDVPPREQQRLTNKALDAAIAEAPIWKEELARIRGDFAIVKSSPASLERLRSRRLEIRRMDFLA